ncbi:MAG: hypothetical protein ABIM60_06870 [candidate division WOR-3 bacterium]
MKEEKIIQRIESVVEELSAEEFVTLLEREPCLKSYRTRIGITSYIICISQFATKILLNYQEELKKYGDLNIWSTNYLTIAVIYGIVEVEYNKFKSLYEEIKKKIKKTKGE